VREPHPVLGAVGGRITAGEANVAAGNEASAKTNAATAAQCRDHGPIADPLQSPIDVKVGVRASTSANTSP
jgi:hypothetical protein